MRIVYKASLKKPLEIPDFWPVPFLSGEFKPLRENNQVIAFEIQFFGQPLEYAPLLENADQPNVQNSITIRDNLLPVVQEHLESALAFIQCTFDIEAEIKEIHAEYHSENEEEEKKIPIKAWQRRRSETPLKLSYDLLTRALLAAERSAAPRFEATLISDAREAMIKERFIDSFRFSFLLIEAVFGDGKSRNVQLKGAFKGNPILRQIVEQVLLSYIRPRKARQSDTEALLSKKPTVDTLLDHLVDKRGFLFHGNLKRNDAWKAEDQQTEEALCFVTLEIASMISHSAANRMYEPDLDMLHYKNAEESGAIMTMRVKFEYNEPNHNSDQVAMTRPL